MRQRVQRKAWLITADDWQKNELESKRRNPQSDDLHTANCKISIILEFPHSYTLHPPPPPRAPHQESIYQSPRYFPEHSSSADRANPYRDRLEWIDNVREQERARSRSRRLLESLFWRGANCDPNPSLTSTSNLFCHMNLHPALRRNHVTCRFLFIYCVTTSTNVPDPPWLGRRWNDCETQKSQRSGDDTARARRRRNRPNHWRDRDRVATTSRTPDRRRSHCLALHSRITT